jgi:predicted O-methyltransferase YrrM
MKSKGEAFLRELPELFDGFPAAETPRDERFAAVLEEVPGLARPNNLALLNLAARCVAPDETYVEVGAFRGSSLIGALLDNDGVECVAIDDFSHSGASRDELERNLARFGVDGRVTILEGDAFELLPGGALAGRRVGVYYYDAAHTYEQQLDGLLLAEPYLVEDALLIVDDTDWDFVDAAVRDYRTQRPNVASLVRIVGKDKGQPWWWEGVEVMEWRAP